MRKIRFVAVLAAVCILAVSLTGCNLVVKNVERDRETVVATVNDLEITKGELEDLFSSEMMGYGYDPVAILSDTTMTDAVNEFRVDLLDELVNQTVLKVQSEAMGFALSEEDKAQARADAQLSLDTMRETLSNQFAQEPDYPTLTGEERAAILEERYQTVLQQQGTTLDGLAASLELQQVNERMLRKVKGDVTVSDELLQERYNALIEEQKVTFAEDPAKYESTMNAYEICAWQPSGFRRAKHILLQISDEEQTVIDNHTKLGQHEESAAAETAALEVLLIKAQEVHKQLDAGIPFDQLVEEKNEDTGMKDPVTKRRGYLLRKETAMAPEFIETAFALENIGDYSEPVKTQFGYHIIQLTEILEEGAVPLEDISKDLTDELLVEEKERIWNETLEAWKKEFDIVTYPDRVQI